MRGMGDRRLCGRWIASARLISPKWFVCRSLKGFVIGVWGVCLNEVLSQDAERDSLLRGEFKSITENCETKVR